MEVQLDGAVAYWLGDHEGRPLGPESGRALDPCLQALERINGGTDPETLALWARLANGGRYLVSNGLILHDLAEAAAGVTAPRRVRRG